MRILTLIVNTDVKTLWTVTEHVRTEHNSGEARGGSGLSLHIANLSVEPAFPFGVAILLDDGAGVEVVNADLPHGC